MVWHMKLVLYPYGVVLVVLEFDMLSSPLAIAPWCTLHLYQAAKGKCVVPVR